MIEDLVIATFNSKKGREMAGILEPIFPSLRLHTLGGFRGAIEPEETGGTYAANAVLKAMAAVEFTGMPSLADDAGLEIDALDGAPGILSKRFGGESLPFKAKMAKILELMKSVPEGSRTARFRCAIAYVEHPSAPIIQIEATCEGTIATAPSGGAGFGYDPIFFLPELGCTMADLTAAQKQDISHRGKVLQAFADTLRKMP